MKITIDTENTPRALIDALVGALLDGRDTRVTHKGLQLTPQASPEPKPEPEPTQIVRKPAPSIFDAPPPAKAAPAAASERLDLNGVVYNPEFCADAKDPYYANGKRKGQWKKRVKVDENVYDEWYASMLPDPDDVEPEDEAEYDTDSAFGASQPAASEPVKALESTGALMQWVATKQAAKAITPDDVAQAYAQAGCQVADLFPPNNPVTINGHLATIYGALVGKAGE